MSSTNLVNKVFPYLFGTYVQDKFIILGIKRDGKFFTKTIKLKKYKKAIKKLHKSPIRLITNHSTCYPLDL